MCSNVIEMDAEKVSPKTLFKIRVALQYIIKTEWNDKQFAFQQASGIAGGTLSNILTGSVEDVRLSTVEKIAETCNKTVSEIINLGTSLSDNINIEVHSPPPTYNNKVVAINQRHHNLIDAFPEAQQEAAYELNEIARDFAENNPAFFEQLLAQARILRDAAAARQNEGGRAGEKKTGSNDSD